MYTDHTVFNLFVQNVFDIVFEELNTIYLQFLCYQCRFPLT